MTVGKIESLDHEGSGAPHRFLRDEDIFSLDQSYLMETAFERMQINRSEYSLDDLPNEDEIERAIDFGMYYTNDESRLIAIYKNIIENNGDFKP